MKERSRNYNRSDKYAGIRQNRADLAKPFPEVLEHFLSWLRQHGVSGTKTIFVLCKDWDLKNMLPAQCRLSKLPLPALARCWISLREEFHRLLPGKTLLPSESALKQMCAHLGVTMYGRYHNAADDAENLRRIARELCKMGRLRTSDKAQVGELIVNP